MSSRIPSQIRWTGHKKKEELLDDPLAESLYGLFLTCRNSPRHISIKPEELINEAYRISSMIYQENRPKDCLDRMAYEIELDLGWKYAVDLVMSMVYVILKVQKKNPRKIEEAIDSITKRYQHNIYWESFYMFACSHSPKQKQKIVAPADLIEKSLLNYKKQIEDAYGKDGQALHVTINLNNIIKGNIDHLHLDHADVAVGVAEKGSNVFHHKIEDNGR